MSTKYITIEEVSGEPASKVHQSLKFKTGNFVWRVKFNLPLRSSTVNNQTCFVTHETNTPLNTNIRYDSTDHYIEIEPLEAYAKNQSYILHVTRAVASEKGQNLKNEIEIRFKL